MEGDETVGWTESLSSTGSSGWGKASDWSGGRIQHADAEIIGWIHFGPSYRGIYILQQGLRALCTRALGMCAYTCMRCRGWRSHVYRHWDVYTNFVTDRWVCREPAPFAIEPVREWRFLGLWWSRVLEIEFFFILSTDLSNEGILCLCLFFFFS